MSVIVVTISYLATPLIDRCIIILFGRIAWRALPRLAAAAARDARLPERLSRTDGSAPCLSGAAAGSGVAPGTGRGSEEFEV